MPANSNSTASVGRPSAKVLWPKGRFTFLALAVLNGAMSADGEVLPKKERRMCTLTLRNHLKRDMFNADVLGDLTVPNPKSEIIMIKGEKGDVTAENGLGRKPILYIRRSVAAASRKAKATTRKAKATTVSVSMTENVATPATAEPVAA